MRHHWTFHQGHDVYRVRVAPFGDPPERARRCGGDEAVRVLSRWLSTSPKADRAVAELRALVEPGRLGARAHAGGAREAVLAALGRGKLELWHERRSVMLQERAPVEETEVLGAPLALEWIEIELVDEAGKPVPNERYTIELPNGRLVDGHLDRQGLAYVRGVPGGTCQVSFPDLDRRVWSAKGSSPTPRSVGHGA